MNGLREEYANWEMMGKGRGQNERVCAGNIAW